MAILQDTLINGNVIRTRDTTYNASSTPATNFDTMGGTKIVADSIGATAPIGYFPYCFGNLFLGSAGATSSSNTEVTESNLRYLSGIQISSGSVALNLVPLNYDYQTKQRNYTFSACLGSSSAPWKYLYLGHFKDNSNSTCYSSYLQGTSYGIEIFYQETVQHLPVFILIIILLRLVQGIV